MQTRRLPAQPLRLVLFDCSHILCAASRDVVSCPGTCINDYRLLHKSPGFNSNPCADAFFLFGRAYAPTTISNVGQWVQGGCRGRLGSLCTPPHPLILIFHRVRNRKRPSRLVIQAILSYACPLPVGGPYRQIS